MGRLAAALSCAAWLAASGALAQPASSSAPAKPAPSEGTTVGEVVVPGKRPAPAELRKQVETFVHDLGRPGPIGQISRWRQGVCPLAAGLTPALDAFVAQRIKDIAERVGAPASAHCGEANVLVVFTTEPDRLMADVRDHHEGLLGYHYVGQTKSLAAFRPPMKSWYVTMTTVPGSFAMLDVAYLPSPPGTGSGSRIRIPLKSAFVFALVVVDSNLLEGQEIGPVADKAAMLALSNPVPRQGCSALPSVMDLMEPSCPSNDPAAGLTAYDEAFLKALYAFNKDELKGYMRQSIRKRVIQAVGPPSPPPPSG